jgi:hypothetical protein
MNELKYETSPYLLQHAENPIYWKAWKPETLQQAATEKQTHSTKRRIFGMPLVPRYGARKF